MGCSYIFNLFAVVRRKVEGKVAEGKGEKRVDPKLLQSED